MRSLFKRLIIPSMIINITLGIIPDKRVFPQSNISPQTDWQKIDLGTFSFQIPIEMKSRDAKGIDSAIWKYSDENSELVIDLGIYSAKPESYSDEPEYTEEKVVIGGKNAVIISFRDSEPNNEDLEYFTGIYFPKVDSRGTKLSFVIYSRNSKTNQAIARKIFNSIKFK